MTKRYSNEVLKFSFGEFSADEKNGFEHKLISNIDLQKQCLEIKALSKLMRNACVQPRQTTIDAILNYA